MIRWELLERIGAYVAGELSGEEAREVERLIFEDPEALGVAESYNLLLTSLSAVGQETPVPPPAIVDNAVRWATNDIRATRACSHTRPASAKDEARAKREDTRKEGRESEGWRGTRA